MISTNQFKIGMTIELEGTLFSIVDFQHVKPGKGGAFVRTKIKNVKTGAVLDKTFRAGEKFEQARMDRRQMQYLYKDGDNLVFMDNESYEQLTIGADQVGEATQYLKEGEGIQISLHEGKPIGVDLPTSVDLAVSHADPGVKGDTATGGTKPANLETGLVIQVPLFVSTGDVVRVDTRTGEYITRVT